MSLGFRAKPTPKVQPQRCSQKLELLRREFRIACEPKSRVSIRTPLNPKPGAERGGPGFLRSRNPADQEREASQQPSTCIGRRAPPSRSTFRMFLAVCQWERDLATGIDFLNAAASVDGIPAEAVGL